MDQRRLRLSFKGTATQLFSYIIILMSMFIMFCSLNKNSLGAVCIGLTLILFVLNINAKGIRIALPFIVVSIVSLMILVMSGNAAERGFNAPINHALKFVYLAYTVVMATSIQGLSDYSKSKIIKTALLSIIISVTISLYSVIRLDRYAIRYYEARGFTYVISFNQFYGVCLVLCILVMALLYLSKKKKAKKYIFICIPIIVCIGLSLYVTGVLICAFGMGLGFAIHKYDQNRSKAAIWAIAIILALLLLFLFGNQVSDWIYRITEPLNFILKDRLRSVADTVFRTDHNLLYSYDRRDELADYSLNSFKAHPLLGIGYKGYMYGTIGCHQEWQDMLGVFGLIGTILFALLMIYLINNVKKRIENKNDLHVFYLAVLVFFVLGFLNPCLSLPVLTAVFIIAPNASLIFYKKEDTFTQSINLL